MEPEVQLSLLVNIGLFTRFGYVIRCGFPDSNFLRTQIAEPLLFRRWNQIWRPACCRSYSLPRLYQCSCGTCRYFRPPGNAGKHQQCSPQRAEFYRGDGEFALGQPAVIYEFCIIKNVRPTVRISSTYRSRETGSKTRPCARTGGACVTPYSTRRARSQRNYTSRTICNQLGSATLYRLWQNANDASLSVLLNTVDWIVFGQACRLLLEIHLLHSCSAGEISRIIRVCTALHNISIVVESVINLVVID